MVPYLNKTEESEFSQFIKNCNLIGYGKTRKDVMNIVESVASSKGVLKKGSISGGWWRRFIQRQNDLVLKKGDSTAYLRMGL